MKKLSILGSGWLGFALAKELKSKYEIKLSTTSLAKLKHLKEDFESFLVNLDDTTKDNFEFLQSEILIVNIPSKT